MTIATKEINRMERLDFSEIYAVYFPRMLRFAVLMSSIRKRQKM